MGNEAEIRATDASGGAISVRGDNSNGVRASDVDRGAVSEGAAIICMIERFARDPSVDVDKMERLLVMQQQAADRREKAAYDAAFAAMQPLMPEIDKRGKIVIKAKDGDKVIQSTPYALWEDTARLIKPILAQFGFGLSFRMTQTADRITTTAVLAHRDGHREETSFSAPIDNTGSKNNVQGWGSSFSYGKRYSATALLNITTRGEDDDGKAAGHVPADQPTLDKLKTMIAETKADTGWICSHYSVETLDDLTAKQIGDAMAGLAARKRAQKVKP